MERTAILVTALVALGVTAISGFLFIPLLRRLKYGQTIKEIGPTWHKDKQGIPTMGGLMMLLGMAAALAVGYITLVLEVPQFLSEQYSAENVRFFSGIGAALLFAGIGFADDSLSVIHRRNLGLRARWKLLLETAVASVYLFVLHRFGGASTALKVPFIGEVDFGVWYYFFAVSLIVGTVNAVNLTDGLDGLASTVTFFYSSAFIVISILLGYVGTGLLATAAAGVCSGFIFWNFYPAKVFMGDTGSLFLGGVAVAMAFGVDYPLLILLGGVIYIAETASVMLQVAYFKITRKITGTGKRLFKMSPIHHHFEMSGWSEIKIVILFSVITVIGCAAAVFAVI